MNVLHLTASRFFGGPERQMLELAEALRPEVDSAFIAFRENDLYQPFLDEVGRRGFRGVVLPHDTPRLLAAFRELIGILRGWKPNVLLCHSTKPSLLGLLAARRIGIPVVSVSRGWTGECARVRFYDALDCRVLRWMDKVVCVSEGQAQKVRRAGVRADKIVVIHNAVRPERFANPDPAYREELRRMFHQPTSCGAGVSPAGAAGTAAPQSSGPDFIVGAAGRLSPEKGFSVLIDAAAQVLGTVPRSGASGQRSGIHPSASSIGFVLFGDGPLCESLVRQIAARGLEGRFILAGFRSDLDQLLAHFDLMVLPSFSEGLPNVALEALAAGVPVVATAVGGTSEVIEDGQTGYLVPPGDASRLADRIVDALSDAAVRQRLSKQGRARIEERFSFVTQARLYEHLFGQLLGKSLPKRPITGCAEQSQVVS